jgi:cell division protein FtsB
MDDEAKQLLREIRDAMVRHESGRKKFMRFVVVLTVVLLALLGYLLARLNALMTTVEQPQVAAVELKDNS